MDIGWSVVVLKSTIRMMVLAVVAIYFLATVRRIFTFLPQGQVFVVMVGENPYKYLERTQARWIHPQTGERFKVHYGPDGSIDGIVDWNETGDLTNPNKKFHPNIIWFVDPINRHPLSEPTVYKRNTTSGELIGISTGALQPVQTFPRYVGLYELMTRKNNSFAEFMEKEFGIHFMHWNPAAYIFEYPFKWNKIEQRPDSPESEFVPRDETVRSLFSSSMYGIVATVKTGSRAAETSKKKKTPPPPAVQPATGQPTNQKEAERTEQITVKLYLGVLVEVTNAWFALFRINTNPRWLGPVTTAVQAGARDVVGRMTLDDLTTGQHEIKKSAFTKMLKELNSDVSGGNPSVQRNVGVRINTVNVVKYEIAGEGAKSLEEAATKLFVAEREGRAEQVKAEGQAKATRTRAQAEAFKIDQEGTAAAGAQQKLFAARAQSDPTGRQAMALAIEKTGVTTLILGGSNQGVLPTLPVGTEEKKADGETDKKGGGKS